MTTERTTEAPTAAPGVRIEPWTAADLALLHKANAPEMTRHLGGPETEEQLIRRHRRYLAADGPGRMYRILLLPQREAVGTIGFWETQWQGAAVCETGWGVLPGFQGRGIAATAVRQVLAAAAAEGRHRVIHAFPSVANAASNAVCRKAGFTLIGACEIEYPKGHLIQAHEWRATLPEPAGPGRRTDGAGRRARR
ncbi:GNAT family N-acetyltransferase [Streptomyces sp. NPDC059101]|uniref:GNAT family N-acetyltransferase n=1 Tax=Streptomyces sp. NPDC059101 TaxID=3346728 RepID=UPI00368031C3